MRGHHDKVRAFTQSPLDDSPGGISIEQDTLHAQMMKRSIQEIVHSLLCLRPPCSHDFTDRNAVHVSIVGVPEWWQHVQETDLRIEVLSQRNRITGRA
jgi:hypothetical protein